MPRLQSLNPPTTITLRPMPSIVVQPSTGMTIENIRPRDIQPVQKLQELLQINNQEILLEEYQELLQEASILHQESTTENVTKISNTLNVYEEQRVNEIISEEHPFSLKFLSSSSSSKNSKESKIQSVSKEEREHFYRENYFKFIANKDHLTFKFKINHQEQIVTPDRISPTYFEYLSELSNKYYTTIVSQNSISGKNKPINVNTFVDFKAYLAMLVEKFSKKNFIDQAYNSCKDYVQKTELVDQCHKALEQQGGSLNRLCWARFAERIKPSSDKFNEQKVKEFYWNDPELDKLLEMSKFGVRFLTDPNFVPNKTIEPIRPLQEKLQNTYQYHIDKLVMAGKAMIFDIRRLNQETKDTLNICSLHLVSKPSTDELPIDPSSGDWKGRPCFDFTNRHDGLLALNEGETKELNIEKFGRPTNPTAGKIVKRWIDWKIENNIKWSDCTLCRQDLDSAFNQVNVNPDQACLMAAGITKHHIVVHDVGNFGHSCMPSAFGILSRATKRSIENTPFEGVLSVITDDYIFLTLDKDHEEANKYVVDILERGTFGKGAVSVKKKLVGKAIGVYGFHVDLMQGSMRPMDKGIQKLTMTIWLFDANKRQPLQLWQCLASLCEYYSHAIRGSRSMIRTFEIMATLATTTFDQKALATPITKAIIEMWRIMILILFIDKEAYNVTIEDFCRSSFALKYDEKWELYESLQPENIRPKRFRMISDAGPNHIGVGIYSFSYKNKTQSLIAYSSIRLGFDDPFNIYQNYREYLGLLMSLLVMQSYLKAKNQKQNDISHEQVYVEWYGDNTGALKWADKNKASSRTAQVVNLMINWFSIVSNIQVYQTEHISGEEMIKLGIDALSRPEKGETPIEFPPELLIDIQENVQETGIMDLCNPLYMTEKIEEVHSIFKDINDCLSCFIRRFSTTNQFH